MKLYNIRIEEEDGDMWVSYAEYEDGTPLSDADLATISFGVIKKMLLKEKGA